VAESSEHVDFHSSATSPMEKYLSPRINMQHRRHWAPSLAGPCLSRLRRSTHPLILPTINGHPSRPGQHAFIPSSSGSVASIDDGANVATGTDLFSSSKLPPELQTFIKTNALSNKTASRYEKELQCWKAYCSEHKISTLNADPHHVLCCLWNKWQSSKSVSSCKTLRSAISTFLSSHSLPSLSTNPLLHYFILAIEHLHPSHPRYDTVFDVTQVYSFLSSLPSNDLLPLVQLRAKLALLLCLTCQIRFEEQLRIERLPFRNESSSVTVSFIDKCYRFRGGKCLPVRICECTDEAVDPLRAARAFIARTDSLFPTPPSPLMCGLNDEKTVKGVTLSKSVKQLLEKAGIDVHRFTAYACKHAGISAQINKGNVSMDLAASHARISPHTLQKHYLRINNNNTNFVEATFHE
jgi:site-specific recombinase XerD